MRLIADVVGQLDLHRPLHQPLGQLRQQPAGPDDLLLGRGTGQQLVDHLIADPPVRRHPESLPQPAAASRTINGIIHQLLAQTLRFSPLQREAPAARLAARRQRRTDPEQTLTEDFFLWLKA